LNNKTNHRIGLISDTHGLVRQEALGSLVGAEVVVHAGDIGKPDVIRALETVAPVKAIRGNNDYGDWARRFPESTVIEVAGIKIYVVHDVNEMKFDPASAGFNVVVSGHSHQPSVQRREGVLYVNPGSAGPRRFKLPIAVGRLSIRGATIDAQIIELSP
jgi:uncharacterized protein